MLSLVKSSCNKMEEVAVSRLVYSLTSVGLLPFLVQVHFQFYVTSSKIYFFLNTPNTRFHVKSSIIEYTTGTIKSVNMVDVINPPITA